MKMIIFGATGKTGRQVVQQALEQGHEVTAFVRSPQKLNQKHENLQVMKGDVRDYDSVKRAIQGQDAVICTLGMPPQDKTSVRANGTEKIIKAMEETGVKRFICQSTYGVGKTRRALPFLMKYLIVPLFLKRAFADHEVQEEKVKESLLDWIIVRPTALTDGEYVGRYQQGELFDKKRVTFKISRADTADFMLKQLVETNHLHKTIGISY